MQWPYRNPPTLWHGERKLVCEVRWDGRKNEFTVMLDETAIAEAHASMRREVEHEKKPTAHRWRRRRARTR
jgi:hypothetical protein